jgi:hypothetical protein
MRGTNPATAAELAARNVALVQAEIARSHASHEAQVEYSETVAKLRERYEQDIAAALAQLRASTRPAYQAYNEAVITAEQSVRTKIHSR